MRAAALTVALAAACAPALAADPWTPTDTAWEAAVQTALVLDWAQTRYIRNDPTRRELNPLIGPYPSMGKVNTYFVTSMVLHGAVAYVLPGPWRRAYQEGMLAFEIGMIGRNKHLGIGFKF